MKRYTTKNIASYIGMLLVLLILIVAILFVTKGIGGTSDGGLRVKVNGQNVGNGSEIVLRINDPIEFTIGNALGGKVENYTIAIVPDVPKDRDFDVICGKELYKFSEIKDLSKGFDIKVVGNKFTLKNTDNVENILSKVFGQAVLVSRDVDFSALPYIRINITSGSDTVSYPLKLGVYPERIEFDKEVILF